MTTSEPGVGSISPLSHVDLGQIPVGHLIHLRLQAMVRSRSTEVNYGLVRQQGSTLVHREGSTSDEPDQVTLVVIGPETPNPDDTVAPTASGESFAPETINRYLAVGDQFQSNAITGRIIWIAIYQV